MTDSRAVGFVLLSALIGWVVAVAATRGWDEPAILFWAAVIAFGGGAVFYLAETSNLPR